LSASLPASLNHSDFELRKSEIEAEEDKYNNIRDDIESRVNSAERALAGDDKELLDFYNKDNVTKNEYLERIYDEPKGEW